jgi:hypothetical protein
VKVTQIVQVPVTGTASPWITYENIHEVAEWCHGTVVQGLFVEIHGPEIEFYSGHDDEYHYAMIGQRILQLPTGYVKVSPSEFEAKYREVVYDPQATPG